MAQAGPSLAPAPVACSGRRRKKNVTRFLRGGRVRHGGSIALEELGTLYEGLNIEGCRPPAYLPRGAAWYNVAQVIDDLLRGDNFEDVMRRVQQGALRFIEEAVGIDVQAYLDTLAALVARLSKLHPGLLVHVHQYEGTTALAQELEARTGVRCILDKTNFYEHPVDYSSITPAVDAVLSVSQCAGFGHAPGTLLYPDRFHAFNVAQGTIQVGDCIPATRNGLATKPCRFLMADCLWNPRPHDAFMDILLDAQRAQVVEFVRQATRHFDDDGHDEWHALAVARWATRFHNSKAAFYLAMLHDVCDHKYPAALPRARLTQWLQAHLRAHEPEDRAHALAKRIDALIDHVSYSTQCRLEAVLQAEGGDVHAARDAADPALVAVRNADRMEALGPVGVARCYGVIRARARARATSTATPAAPLAASEDAQFATHAREKLLRLLPEGFIRLQHEQFYRGGDSARLKAAMEAEVLRRHVFMQAAVEHAEHRELVGAHQRRRAVSQAGTGFVHQETQTEPVQEASPPRAERRHQGGLWGRLCCCVAHRRKAQQH